MTAFGERLDIQYDDSTDPISAAGAFNREIRAALGGDVSWDDAVSL